MGFTRNDVEQALILLQTQLRVEVDPMLQQDYECGRGAPVVVIAADANRQMVFRS